MGFEPVTSALALQCSPSWAMKTHILEAGQFIEFINPWKEWNTEWNCDGHILISFVFLQFTLFHSVFHSFQGLMNSINWPASSIIWVFIAQLGEHCSANTEATGSNPLEAPKNFFSGYFRNCLNCDSLRWSHTHFTYKFVAWKLVQSQNHWFRNEPEYVWGYMLYRTSHESWSTNLRAFDKAWNTFNYLYNGVSSWWHCIIAITGELIERKFVNWLKVLKTALDLVSFPLVLRVLSTITKKYS